MKYSKVKVCLKEQPVVVTITSDEKPNISDLMVNKWQDIIDLIALTVNVPSALIMRLEEKYIYVFLESNTKGNPYNKGEKAELCSGLYCETVAGKKSCLLVPNALKDPLWKENPDIELNMISYLGFPIIWPDGEVFGTICVLDNKENHYNNKYVKLIEILKYSIEKDLQLIMEEQKLKQQKEELEAILENMSDGLFIINKEGIFTTANKLARDILLIPSENHSIKDVYEEIEFLDDKGNLVSYENLLCLKVMRGEKVFAQRLTVKQKDKVIYIEVNATPIYDKEGNFIAGVVCIHDVTEQVNKDELIKMQKDELIRMQKSKLSAIIENMSDGLFTVNKNRKITLLNESAKEFFWNSGVLDVPEDTHTPTKYYDSQGNLLTAETMPAARIFKGESIKSYRMTCDRPDGIYHFNISGSPICDKDGNIEKVLICSRNQTEAVKNIEMIKMQNDQLEAIIENMHDCLLVFNKDGNIIKYSKTAGDYIEKHSEIITINDYFRHIEVSDLEGNSLSEENLLVARIVNGKKVLGYKFAAKINNTVFYFELNGNPIYDSKGNFVVGVIMIRDITEEVNYKNKMEETLKVQDEIFANISHELKTPLNVIYSTNQLIELYLKNGSFEANKEKIYKNVGVIKQNCYRFSKLINNMVDLSKIDSGFFNLSLVNENIVCVIEDIVESVSEYIKGAGIDIIFDTNTEEKIIACDPEKIERIILNLISNAIKFTSSGGSISIDLIDRGDTVEIAIKDTGVGIDKKHLNNIFKRFYQVDKSLTRNAEGSGIGLSLVKSLVELHGGKISIESMVGEGSVFKIELPSRTIEKDEEVAIDKIMPKDNKIEMINIEFSDIYSI